MGTYVHLEVVPQRIDADAWREAWDKSLEFLQRHRLRLSRLRERAVTHDRRLVVMTRDLVSEDPQRGRIWRVDGDVDSLERAESVELPRDLIAGRVDDSNPSKPPSDVTLELYSSRLNQAASSYDAFGHAKTQGAPYHIAMLGVGMLFEHHFPGVAMVWGDIDLAQCTQAQADLAAVLNLDVALPVCLRLDELLVRGRRELSGVELVDYCTEVFGGERDLAIAACLADLGEDTVASWFKEQVGGYDRIEQSGAVYLCGDWLEAGGSLKRLLRMLCLDIDGPRFPIPEVAQNLLLLGALNLIDDTLEAALVRVAATPLARHLRAMHGVSRNTAQVSRFDPERYIEALEATFPHANLDWQELVKASELERRRAREQLQELSDEVRIFDAAAAEPGARTSDLKHLPNLAALSAEEAETLRESLALLAHTHAKMIAQVWQAAEKSGFAPPVIVQLMGCQQRLILPEEAWDRIEGERDPLVLDLLLALVQTSGADQHVDDITHSLLLNLALLRELAPWVYSDAGRAVFEAHHSASEDDTVE